MKRNFIRLLGMLAMTAALTACSGASGQGSSAGNSAATDATAPRFTADADSLFQYVADQVDLGPRVPGSDAHRQCGDMIVSRLGSYGIDSVAQQLAPVVTFDGTRHTARNIMGCINPDAAKRVLLLAHYDTRPWADNDPVAADRTRPIAGANDGGSGVAVLLETARVLGKSLPDSVGVDLLFVDLEDSGTSGGAESESSWCLGTQEWVKQMPYTTANRPMFGILLDMVGGQGAVFHREYISHQLAPAIVDRIWAVARESGFGDRFVNSVGGAVVDDHLFVNRAGIPCIDIIESQNAHTGSFNPTWHTTSDNLGAIDRNSLKAAAQVVLNAIDRL